MNLMKNKFLFILIISIATLVVLIVGAISLYKDNSLMFTNDGYIIETSTKTNTKYYFSANTKYKENVEEKITFSDKENNKVVVDPASFVHYNNGNVSFLQKGALVNLADITSPMVSYYNITNENTIVYEKEHYTVTSNNKKINIDSFVGRINDNKYLIAGKNLSLKIPTEANIIAGDYFEVNFIEEGIVKIYNKDNNYQVTAQDSYLYIGDEITISLGDGKIFYDGEAKMLLSQITINNNENINLDVEEEKGGAGGSGAGSGTGEAEGTGGEGAEGEGEGTGEGSGGGSGNGNGEGKGEDTGEGEGTGEGSGSGSGEETGDGDKTGEEDGTGSGGGSGEGGDNTTASPQIELIEAVVTSTTIDLTMQLNNASLARGNIMAYLTNIATGNKETPKRIELNNGTFELPYTSLMPDTNYALTIVETGIASEKQYFQKTFITKELGITLEKTYATSDTLAYNLIFDENTEVTQARISIYDNNGTNENISPNEFTISAKDFNNNAIFTGLKSNTSYSINVDTVWINNTAYSNLYTINRIDTTLKETPRISGVDVTANAEEVKFNIELKNVTDKDKSIISYTYNIYLADDITLENTNPQIQYSITKNDSDPLVLNLNEIDALKTGVDYRCKIIAEYNDNEMIREVSTDYSSNFLIRSKPKLSFELNATMNKIEGTISLIDANCTVPMNGRTCSNENNTFTLRYYESSEEEATAINEIIKFDSTKLTSEISLTNLKSNSWYVIKVFGNYYDDDNVLHPNVQIGDTYSIQTLKSENIYFEHVGDNISGQNKDGSTNIDNVVTFDAKLTAPSNSNIIEEISTVTFNLYSGRYNTNDKLIGSYTITNKTSIEDLFNNITINNGLFIDTTNYNLGKIDTLEKLIRVTNNSNGTLNGSYTVEVADVMDSTGKNEITVENNVYTFNLTSSYYLDARIETNSNENYLTITPILKEHLTEEEYEKLSKDVKNLDELNDDTVVGLTIENSLSDIFVDSAYKYEKAIVNYTICNDTMRDCDKYLKNLTDNDPNNDEEAKEVLKIISIDMGNKYQPKAQTIYLDSSEYKDVQKYFIRGYNYKIGFYISFVQEDGATPHYTNEKLHKVVPIEKQAPIYTQYISTSDKTSVTYRYNFKDIDSALADNNFYYTIGDDKNTYLSVEDSLIADNKNHDVRIPIENINNYTLYYSKKNTSNKVIYNEITTSDFETEYTYDEENAYIILDSKDNMLKIKLENNDVNKRAVAYKVVISTVDRINISDYIRYFLASKLTVVPEDTGNLNEKGEPITIDYKYINIDYAIISKFMGHKLKVTVYSYFDSGLIGYNQVFNNGLILQNKVKNKYLNIYNSGSNTTTTADEKEEKSMGIYLLKEPFKLDSENIYIYNHLMDSEPSKYNSSLGATYYDTDKLPDNIGINFGITTTNNGIILTHNDNNYVGYDAKVLKEAELKTNANTYIFETIVPIIKVSTNNTINSIRTKIEPSGIYGNKQFVKDNQPHNKAYIELYSDFECTNKITTKETNINISGNDEKGYIATIDEVEFNNLNPQTTYYFKVYAYVNNKRIQLYDSSSSTEYITRTYSSTTLNATGILKSIKYSVEPKNYNGESSEKYLTWKLNLKNKENYKLRFELYEPDGTITETNPETGEEIVKTNYKAVKFDGTNANSCDINASGDSSNGYVKNCYILVDKDEIENANNKDQIYKFTKDNFVFGGNYYKLLVYAIPFTNNKYIEEQKVLLYQNDSLTTTPSIQTVNGIEQNINIPVLNEATFTLSNSLAAGYRNEDDGYYVSFVPTVTDNHKVIKYGSYTVRLKDEKGNIISQLTNVTSGISTINEKIEFTSLTSNTLYYVELLYETYRNNVGYTEEQKIATTPFTDFIYTPISNDITLGTITAGNATGKAVTLTYNGSTNLSEKIVRVDYTISLKGGSSKTTGTYKIDSNNQNIFTISTDKTPKLTIDTSNSMYSTNTSFNFRTGNTYIITTQYYYLNNGKEELLMDQVTNNTTYTTILNL